MIKSIVINLSKKYIIGYINDLLENHRANISEIMTVINVWVTRLEIIIKCFRSIIERISDGVIEDDEISASTDEISKIILQW